MNNDSRLDLFFNALSDLKVLIIGDAILDSYVWGEVGGISPEAPVPFVRVKKRDSRMGGAANVASNIRSLGATPILCTIVGDDKAGQQLLMCMQKNDILKEGVLTSTERPTTIKTRVIANQRHIVRVDEESDDRLTVDEEHRLIQCIEKLLPQCDVVIFEDYDKGAVTHTLIAKTIAQAHAKGISVVVDPKKKNFFSYKNATLIKPNLKELSEAFNQEIQVTNKQSLIEAVDILKKKLNTNVLLTLSEAGLLLDYKTEQIRLEGHPLNIVDVSGAGDTVISVAALCVALDLEPRLLALLSNLGGGLACKRVGVAPIDRDELWHEANVVMGSHNP